VTDEKQGLKKRFSFKKPKNFDERQLDYATSGSAAVQAPGSFPSSRSPSSSASARRPISFSMLAGMQSESVKWLEEERKVAKFGLFDSSG